MNTLADRLKAAGSAHSRQITNELTTELARIPGITINANEARLRDRNIGTEEEPQWPANIINNGVAGLITYKQVPLIINFINYDYADLYFPLIQVLKYDPISSYIRTRGPRSTGWRAEPAGSIRLWPMTAEEKTWLKTGVNTVTARQLLNNIDYYAYNTQKHLKVSWSFHADIAMLTKKLESTYKTYIKLAENPETPLALMEALLPKYLSSIFLPRKQWFEGLPEATRKHL